MKGVRLILMATYLISFLLSFAMLISSITHAQWWELNVKYDSNATEKLPFFDREIGLWESCISYNPIFRDEETCTKYNDTLKFKDETLLLGNEYPFVANRKDFDVVLLLLIIETIGLTFCIIGAIASFLYRERFYMWKKVLIILLIVALLTAIIGLIGLVFSEYKYRNTWLKSNLSDFKYTHGWSVILAWVSTLLTVISCAQIACMIRFMAYKK